MSLRSIFVFGILLAMLSGCDGAEVVDAKSDAKPTESTKSKSDAAAAVPDKGTIDTAESSSKPNAAGEKVAQVEKTTSITKNTASVDSGKELFNENCAACHQDDAIGKPGIAPSLTNPELLAAASDKFLIETIKEGRANTGMPPFEHLAADEINDIVAFLRDHTTIPNKSAEIDAQPEAHGDPRLGKLWFDNICSTCHGQHGDGYEAGGTGTAIGKAGFLNKVSDGFIRTTIKYGRSNTRMLGFSGADALANLSDQEIDDIIVYMRTLANSNEEANRP